ncbi:MAG: hypothetical protein JXA35_04180 [Deltaproteobacteria bacterium]|nr:hypothetical protein [Deltaproteobacteria bacterium]
MLINWFTVIAQIVNFLILVVLLKYLLYDRIIKGMEKREKEIESRYDDAENREAEARKQKEENEKEREKIDQKKDQMLNDAKKEADRNREELLESAKKEVEDRRAEWFESLEKERGSFLDELRRLASKHVYSLTRKVIADLADSDLDELISGKFVGLLKNLEEDEKKELSSAVEKEKDIVIKSSSGLSKELRGRITRIIHDEIHSDSEVSYETDEEMMPGIELFCGGQEIIWSTERYLEELEQETNRLLDRQRMKLKAESRDMDKNSDEKDTGNEQGEDQ